MGVIVSTNTYRRNGRAVPGAARRGSAYAEACRARKERERKHATKKGRTRQYDR